MDNPTNRFQAKRYIIQELQQKIHWILFYGGLGFDIFDEEDVDEVLDECFAKVARDGDLSSRQKKKINSRQKDS